MNKKNTQFEKEKQTVWKTLLKVFFFKNLACFSVTTIYKTNTVPGLAWEQQEGKQRWSLILVACNTKKQVTGSTKIFLNPLLKLPMLINLKTRQGEDSRHVKPIAISFWDLSTGFYRTGNFFNLNIQYWKNLRSKNVNLRYLKSKNYCKEVKNYPLRRNLLILPNPIKNPTNKKQTIFKKWQLKENCSKIFLFFFFFFFFFGF